MTRLRTEWIKSIAGEVKSWDETLVDITGKTLLEIAAAANGLTVRDAEYRINGKCVAVIPITAGEGIIETFQESIAAIVKEIGFSSWVCSKSDIDGMYEAYISGADIIFAADDARYLAMNIGNKQVGENDLGTARGYIEVLDAMSQKHSGNDLTRDCVLVLGFGRLGKHMCKYLENKGIKYIVYDTDPSKKKELYEKNIRQIEELSEIKQYDRILDATSNGDWLNVDILSDKALIAAPGVPLSLDKAAQKKFAGRYVHDNLEIGTAVMAIAAAGGSYD